MKTIREICAALEMPEEVMKEMLQLEQGMDFERLEKTLAKLFCEDTWTKGLEELRKELGDDPKGMKMLTCMMKCGLKTFAAYQELKIPEKVFVDSLKCFSRFVREHRESFGVYGFDREWWTVRQLSGKLFRIGELEYELKECGEDAKDCKKEGNRREEDDKEKHTKIKYISLHIPSDADLDLEAVHNSYRDAGLFLHKYFPEYEHTEVRCSSWLLAPALQEVLLPTSRIIQFQREFIMHRVDEESNSFMQWVYKRSDWPLQMLPEETTLQRNLKQYLLAGGKVGEGAGYLPEKFFESPFTEE